jgi:hypothetical protein
MFFYTLQLERSKSNVYYENNIINLNSHKIVQNNFLQMDLSLLVWALIDKNSSGSTYYYFSVFNLNNWYSQCMPSKMKQLCELNVDGSNRIRKNVYFLNYSLPLNCDLESLKVIQETPVSAKDSF